MSISGPPILVRETGGASPRPTEPALRSSATAGRTAVRPTDQAALNDPSAPGDTEEGDRVVLSEASLRRASAEVSDSSRERDREDDLEPGELTESEQDLVDRLEDRDREVRAHEQAHLAAAGALARGGAKYEYQTGPDGRRYAVGGSVSIDTSPVANDPEATIQKAERIKRAALAPAEPSSTDRAVAAKADRLKVRAQRELQQEALEGADRPEGIEPRASSLVEPDRVGGPEPSYGPRGVEPTRPELIGANLSLEA